MVLTFGWIALGGIASLTLMQAVIVNLHRRFLQSSVAASIDGAFKPQVAIILCVRGSDPRLRESLRAINEQNYDQFLVHIVADDPHDAAVETVRQEMEANLAFQPSLHYLSTPSKTRSLKCSAIIEAISNLEDSIEVIALIDSDVIPDPNWLTDLIMPLSDPTVGATTGNRWFASPTPNLASSVRQIWNGAAVAQMTCYEIPWGGSLAMKRTVLEACNLTEHWSDKFCEDTTLPTQLKAHQLRVVRIPNLILNNDESTTLKATFHWISRQLLTVRLYHSAWPLVVIHSLFSFSCLIACLVLIPTLFVSGHALAGSLLAIGFTFFQIINAILFAQIQKSNLAVIHHRLPDCQIKPSQPGIMAFLVTQALYPCAILKTIFTRVVSWRGISYSIKSRNQIEMVQYQPFPSTTNRDVQHNELDSIN
ncbi:MAG: glycosyltransferase family 2 protein [Mariniblastus sp.]|nr:glycosyltransferase family 2 protein [Mariniblastus sp.]